MFSSILKHQKIKNKEGMEQGVLASLQN